MLVRAAVIGALLSAVVVGCAAGCDAMLSGALYSCKEPEPGHRGPDGVPDPCHYQDAAGGTDAGEDVHLDSVCEVGQYVHWSIKWASPTLLWIGAEDQAPECPFGPESISYEGHTDLVAPIICDACTCEPSMGDCSLPTTLTASSAPCGAPGGVTTSFDAPTPWDGQCDSTTKVPGGAAHSLKADPLVVTDTGCASGPPIPSKISSLHWNTYARGCDTDLPMGPLDRSICLTDDVIPSGFALCIFRDGDRDCPPDSIWTERHVFYEGVQDDRQCSACACGAPTGSLCKAQLAIYDGSDMTCSGPPFAQIPITSAAPACLDITLPGQSLGGKSASAVTYVPGTCPAVGGDASGSALPIGPSTLCCRP